MQESHLAPFEREHICEGRYVSPQAGACSVDGWVKTTAAKTGKAGDPR